MSISSGSISFPPLPNIATYVFVDGTNLFAEFRNAQLHPPSIMQLLQLTEPSQRLVRICVYTTDEKAQKAREEFGANFFDNCRVIHGVTVKSQGNNGKEKNREKGVDAQLVADLVYHAATRNANHVILVANDSDFQFALKRVEDFGCTTELRWFIRTPCQSLVNATDKLVYLDKEALETRYGATAISKG
jgi:uncharacterized LabA/DUF88 family protein